MRQTRPPCSQRELEEARQKSGEQSNAEARRGMKDSRLPEEAVPSRFLRESKFANSGAKPGMD